MRYRAIAYILLGIAGITVIATVPFMASYYYQYVNFPFEVEERDIYLVFFNGDWSYQHTINGETTLQDFENSWWGSYYQPFVATLMMLGMALGILTGGILLFSDLDDRIRITGGITSLTGGALGLIGSLSWIPFGRYVANYGPSPSTDYFFVGFYLTIAFSFAFLVVGLVYTITSIVRLVKNPNFYVRKPKVKKVTRFDDIIDSTYEPTTTSYGKQFGSYVSETQVVSTPQYTPSIDQRVQAQTQSNIKRISIIVSAVAASNFLLLFLVPFIIYQEDGSFYDLFRVNIFLDGRFRLKAIYNGEVEIETGHMANIFTEGYPSYISVLATIGLCLVLLGFIQKLFVNTRVSQIYNNSMIIGGSALGLSSLLGYLKFGNQVIIDLTYGADELATYSAGLYINCLLFAGYLGLGIYLMTKITDMGPIPSTKSYLEDEDPFTRSIRQSETIGDSIPTIVDDIGGYSFDFEENAKAIKTSDLVYQRQSQIATLKELVGNKEEVDINLLHMVSQISISTIKEIAVEDLAMIVIDGKLITQQKQNEINAAKKAAKKAAAKKKKKAAKK
ncbi:MAG: hypothetical protein ACTSPK_10280 [Candidatus Heimdallarchaeota archaeon]